MNGANQLIRTLVQNNVDVCFANPGTSEMHFVAALDEVTEMRAVLGLFEGVCTGAADGFGRMAGKPAATLLHLGPGLANGLANLHNARRANTPIINVVGEHATYHIQYDAPLTTDIEQVARPFSHWIRTSNSASAISRDTADAITAAHTAPGQIATLILPGDTAWTPTTSPLAQMIPPPPPSFDDQQVEAAAKLLHNGKRSLILIGGSALYGEELERAGQIATATGAAIMSSRPVARRALGAGRPIVKGIVYAVNQALRQLEEFEQILLIGCDEPIAFFAYPNMPSRLSPPGCHIHTVVQTQGDIMGALDALATACKVVNVDVTRYRCTPPDLPTGSLTVPAVWQSVAAQLPDEAIIVNESLTSGRGANKFLLHVPPHDMLNVTGGAIGIGLPLSVGAAVACPDRQVIDMQADGSSLYTIQALWTQAREQLDIVTILFNNRAYRILEGELAKVGAAGGGSKAGKLLNLDSPTIDFVSIARGFGVEASRADDAASFNDQLRAALENKGPHLIEVLV